MNSTIHTQALPAEDGLSDEAFLAQAYMSLLGRSIDPTGFRDYLAKMQAGLTRTEVCGELARSEEGRRYAAIRSAGARISRSASQAGFQAQSAEELLRLDGVALVEQTYRALLGREPDPSGLQHYLGRLASGVEKAQIIKDIWTSPEGQSYDARLPGLPDLINAIGSKPHPNRDEIARLMQLPDDAFISAAYRRLLGRDADASGGAFYMSSLQQGMSRWYVIKQLACSEEAGNRAAHVNGLARALRRYEAATARTWKGWYLRNVKGVESDFPTERAARALMYLMRRRDCR